jgi:hypothetical protein
MRRELKAQAGRYAVSHVEAPLDDFCPPYLHATPRLRRKSEQARIIAHYLVAADFQLTAYLKSHLTSPTKSE